MARTPDVREHGGLGSGEGRIRRTRRLWQLLEPLHALTYFAPEAREAFERSGLRGFWRGYFAGRAAPMGAVGPGVVTACFFGFHPSFVARALPEIWSMASPDAALAARLAGIDAALRRAFDDELEASAAEAGALLRPALETTEPAGRPLFAANAALPWPSRPDLALWHAATLVREHRGDGHVVALTAAGLDPCEAHVSRLAADGSPPDSIQPYRGWGDEDWHATAERLRQRGWLEETGTLTRAGETVRQGVEDETDRLAAGVIDALGDDGFARLTELLTPIAERLRASGAIPYPNPIGVPPPS